MTTVFTNGCFELLHPGHIDLLARARALGDRLIVGLNSDASIRAIKGPRRPVVAQETRAAVLRALRSVDEVVVFDDPTPIRLIETLRPDIIVKGGDWPVDQIVGADLVRRVGGKVVTLPLVPGHSTTALVARILSAHEAGRTPVGPAPAGSLAARSLEEHQQTMRDVARECLPAIERAGDMVLAAISAGGKVLLCGNGGSASDAEHIAAELTVRFEDRRRRSYPAIALGANTAALTALGNDYGFEQLFARQLEGLAQPGDVLVALSTSGESANVLAAVMTARRLRCATVALTGARGTRLASLCDAAVLVPSTRTARIQEAHITVAHLWCERLDARADMAGAP